MSLVDRGRRGKFDATVDIEAWKSRHNPHGAGWEYKFTKATLSPLESGQARFPVSGACWDLLPDHFLWRGWGWGVFIRGPVHAATLAWYRLVQYIPSSPIPRSWGPLRDPPVGAFSGAEYLCACTTFRCVPWILAEPHEPLKRTAYDILSEGLHAAKQRAWLYLHGKRRHAFLSGYFDPLLYLVATERNGDTQGLLGPTPPQEVETQESPTGHRAWPPTPPQSLASFPALSSAGHSQQWAR